MRPLTVVDACLSVKLDARCAVPGAAVSPTSFAGAPLQPTSQRDPLLGLRWSHPGVCIEAELCCVFGEGTSANYDNQRARFTHYLFGVDTIGGHGLPLKSSRNSIVQIY